MKTKISVFLLIFWVFTLCGQSEKDYQTTIQNLEINLSKGKKMALRDAGTLLNQQELIEVNLHYQTQKNHVGSLVLELLRNYCYFPQNVLDLKDEITSEEFLDFFYKNENQIQFNPFAKAFFIENPEKIAISYQIKSYNASNEQVQSQLFKYYQQDLAQELRYENYEQLPPIIKKIGDLKTEEAYQFLMGCLAGRYWEKNHNPMPDKMYEAIFFALRHYPKEETLTRILKTIESNEIPEEISLHELRLSLAYICNHYFGEEKTKKEIAFSIHQLFTQYIDFERIRQAGYDKVFDFSPKFFENEADYYGKIIQESETYYWLKINATQALLKIKNPRALLHLAALYFQNRGKEHLIWYDDLNIPQKLRELTKSEIWVNNSSGKLVPNYENEPIAQLNYFLYCLQHYQDYSWNETEHYFKNQKEKPEIGENYEQAFQQLFQSNTKNALITYSLLTQAKADEMSLRCATYQQILFLPNQDLPTFPFVGLEKLSQLNAFCEELKLPFTPSPELENDLDKLKTKISPSQRYILENELITRLKLEEITTVEYWGILNQNTHTEVSISIGRILDKFYSKNWGKIINNDLFLRLYLKKAILFSQLKLKGYCNFYLQKFKGMEGNLKQKFIYLLDNEIDKDIRQALLFLSEESELALQDDLKQFFRSPSEKLFDKIKQIPLHHETDFKYISERIKELKDITKIKLLFAYWEQNPAIKQVPALISLLSDQRVIEKRELGKQILYYTVAELSVAQLERIYKHSFADEKDFYKIKKTNTYIFKKTASQWLNLWNEKGANYQNWEEIFFTQKINRLENEPQISINLVNNIYYSPFFSQEKHEARLWEVFAKIKPQTELIYFPLRENISEEIWQKIAPYLHDATSFAHFVARLQTQQPKIFIEKLIEKMNVLDLYRQGEIYYQLFLNGNLREWFAQPNLKKYIPAIKEALNTYSSSLDNYELEYLLSQRFIFFLENTNQNSNQQFAKAQSIKRNDLRLEILEDILINAGYQNLPKMWTNCKNLKTEANRDWFRSQLHQYIQEDLGILSDDMSDSGLEEMMALQQQLSEKEFYRHYARKAGLNILDESGNLVYQTLYDILKYDVVNDFVNLMPSLRASQVFLAIRLLELEFATKLGLPNNLHHTYSFVFRQNIRPRANQWRKYLETKNLIKMDAKESESFGSIH